MRIDQEGKVNIMKLRKTLLGALLAAASMVPMAASASITWAWNYAGLNAAEGYVPAGPFAMGPVSSAMDELKYTAESIIHWTSGLPFAVGSKFDDYVLLRVDGYNLNDVNVSEVNYGSGFPGIPGDHQFTIAIKASGIQTGPNTYSILSLPLFELRYDSGVGGAYTNALFTGPLGNFTDGTLAETGVLISGGGSNTSVGIPDGSIGLIVGLIDNLHNINPLYGTTELFDGINTFLPLPLAVGISDSNNNLCATDGGSAVCGSTELALKTFFGIAGVDDTVTFHTRSDGSVNKNQVPEPGTLALFGAALFGLAAARRRGKTS